MRRSAVLLQYIECLVPLLLLAVDVLFALPLSVGRASQLNSTKLDFVPRALARDQQHAWPPK
jgi:hypothetical protein